MSTVVILDWDDTLFPSWWMFQNQLSVRTPYSLTAEQTSQMNELETEVIILFTTLLSITNLIYIVTNAEKGWIELSSATFYQSWFTKIYPKIKIISARTEFQDKYPDDYVKWKFYSMQSILSTNTNNIISIGDSSVERDAVRAVGASIRCKKTLIKTLKLKEKPCISQIVAQLRVLTRQIPELLTQSTDLDLELDVIEREV